MIMENLFKNIKLIAFDVDGVFTDGRIYISDAGVESKAFHTQDGHGIRQILEVGIKVAIISGRKSQAVSMRMEELSIEDVYLGCKNKEATFQALLKKYSIRAMESAFVGDDIPDVKILKVVGLPIAVANARSEVKKIAKYITKNTGGSGAIREITDLLLKQ
jgi:3-deoxy-D-manno-octulosonate 8-phosphate phosphatase (KDO 8-P phosphatase)